MGAVALYLITQYYKKVLSEAPSPHGNCTPHCSLLTSCIFYVLEFLDWALQQLAGFSFPVCRGWVLHDPRTNAMQDSKRKPREVEMSSVPDKPDSGDKGAADEDLIEAAQHSRVDSTAKRAAPASAPGSKLQEPSPAAGTGPSEAGAPATSMKAAGSLACDSSGGWGSFPIRIHGCHWRLCRQ